MKRFGKKTSYLEYAYTKPALLVLVVVLYFLGTAVFERYSVEREMSARQVEAQAKQSELLKRKETLEERVEYLEGERGVEEEMRKHFDVAKEGEQVVILMGDTSTQPTNETVETPKKTPWYIFWR